MMAMRNPRRLALFLGAAMICFGLVAAQSEAADTYALEVAGLACPFCAYGIEKRLGKLDGVDGVEVDIAGGRALVTMRPGASLTRERAAAAVDEAGFTLRGFEAVDRDGADDGRARD